MKTLFDGLSQQELLRQLDEARAEKDLLYPTIPRVACRECGGHGRCSNCGSRGSLLDQKSPEYLAYSRISSREMALSTTIGFLSWEASPYTKHRSFTQFD